jgi:hypothetical protein
VSGLAWVGIAIAVVAGVVGVLLAVRHEWRDRS